MPTTRPKTTTLSFAPALKFLRSLKRNNDREWFNARKEAFLEDVQTPFLELIDSLNRDLPPDFVRPAKKIALRIYRDTRFSNNKLPYKTNLAAWWARVGMEKTSGAGFYLSISPSEVMIAAGIYMPQRDQLLALRRAIADDPTTYRKALEDKKLRRLMPGFDTNPLTRVPKGFDADHPAADLLRCRQYGASATLPAEAALAPNFRNEILKYLKAATPLVTLLNTPLLQTRPAARKTLF